MKYEYLNGTGSVILTGSTCMVEGVTTNVGTSTCSTFTIQYNKKLEGVEFIVNEEGNFIEITYSHTPTSLISYSFNSPSGKSMSKERYGVVDGKMHLIKTIKGIETPGYYVEPDVEWEE